jgi:origin recognition complex subunit 1
MPTPLTPRRSRRYEPLRVGNQAKAALSSSQTNKWTGEPTGTRPAEQTDYQEDEEFDEKDPGQVLFYSSFTRSSTRAKVPLRTYGKALGVAAASQSDETAFAIGDVVLVASETKKPSIGVITGMWQVIYPEDDAESDGEGERMKVQIHWFMRPTQLASVRVKRDHFEVCLCSSWFVSCVHDFVFRMRYTTRWKTLLLYLLARSLPIAPSPVGNPRKCRPKAPRGGR